MHIVKLAGPGAEPSFAEEASKVLHQGGLVCFPCHGKYRLAASLTDSAAVTALFQSKRRVGKSPALVFVASEEMLRSVVAEVDATAQKLIKSFWPGSLTILFEANPNLPRTVTKQILRGNGRIGVRVPDDPVALQILEAFGGPVLISSANKEKKAGDGSPAQVKKNFVHRVDLFVDAGDLRSELPSTVVDVSGGSVRITRPGSIEESRILASGE